MYIMIGLNLLVRYIKLQVCMYATLRVARHKRYTLFEINSGREIQSPNINLAGLIKARVKRIGTFRSMRERALCARLILL